MSWSAPLRSPTTLTSTVARSWPWRSTYRRSGSRYVQTFFFLWPVGLNHNICLKGIVSWAADRRMLRTFWLVPLKRLNLFFSLNLVVHINFYKNKQDSVLFLNLHEGIPPPIVMLLRRLSAVCSYCTGIF
jgi:hypothetical protein